mgnify:CR=1 FL=1
MLLIPGILKFDVGVNLMCLTWLYSFSVVFYFLLADIKEYSLEEFERLVKGYLDLYPYLVRW